MRKEINIITTIIMSWLIETKISLRNLLRNKTQSLVSILGLGIGLGCIMLITLLYIHENSFDRYIPNNDCVYRVIHGDDCRTSFPLAESAGNEIPAIESAFRYFQNAEFEIRTTNNQLVKEEQFASSDETIFDCLGIPFILGKPAQTRNEVAISSKMAHKYFDTDDAVGKVLEVRLNNDFFPLTVCGVYKDFPSNSSLSPNFISNTELLGELLEQQKKKFGQYGEGYDNFKDNWDRSIYHTYIRLHSKNDAPQVIQQLQKYRKHFSEDVKKQQAFSLQPVADVYLKSANIGGDLFSRRGNANELKYYIAIALLILLIAIINYMFLYKAKMENRLKEIGAKKALGAASLLIRKQMLAESNLVSAISLIPASIVILLGVPFINSTLSRTLDASVFTIWYAVPLLILIVLLTGTVSGFFVGTKIAPVSTVLLLNKKTSLTPKNNWWSNSFLSLHFAIFVVLIVSVLTLSKQINFALNNFTAINPRNILVAELNTRELAQKFDVIKNETDQLPGVQHSAGSSFIPPFNGTLPIRLKSEGEHVKFDGLIMGQGMTELLGMQLIDGDHFGDFNNGQVEIILNESAALQYNLKAGEIFNGFKIRGIVKDFTAHTLHELIQPMVIIQQNPKKMRLLAVKTDGNNNQAIKASLAKILKDISPDKNPNVYLLTDEVSRYYSTEQNQAKLIGAFSFLAIVLSIMGLLGMVMNTVSKRTKEIGIRKVNGAKVSEILAMLNKDFIKWVAIAFVIAYPLAYYAMNKWLENFAYKTNLSWWIFALAGLMALGIALLTVSWQSWRAATRNPVEALRYE